MTEKTTKELTYIQKSILSHLGESQMTSRQLAEKIGCSISAARNGTRHLRGKGLIFVAATRRLHHGFFEKVYAAHAKHEKPRAVEKIGGGITGASRLHAILSAIDSNGPMTAVEIADWIGCEKKLVQQSIRYSRKVHKSAVLKIAKWVEVEGNHPFAQVYARGPGRDAPKPEKVNIKERRAAWREKNRELIKAKHAAWRASKGAKSVIAGNPFWGLLSANGVTGLTAVIRATSCTESEAA